MTLSRRNLLGAAPGVAAAWAGALSLAPVSALAQTVAGNARSSSPDTPDEARAPALPAVGSVLRLPDITLMDGRLVRAADLNGQVTVIYWWASWCPFCALQSPAVEKLWRDGQPRGLKMLALSIDRRPEDAARYLAAKGYTFPAAMVTPAMTRVLPKPKGLPVTLVRGRDGKLLSADSGQMFPEDVEELARFL